MKKNWFTLVTLKKITQKEWEKSGRGYALTRKECLSTEVAETDYFEIGLSEIMPLLALHKHVQKVADRYNNIIPVVAGNSLLVEVMSTSFDGRIAMRLGGGFSSEKSADKYESIANIFEIESDIYHRYSHVNSYEDIVCAKTHVLPGDGKYAVHTTRPLTENEAYKVLIKMAILAFKPPHEFHYYLRKSVSLPFMDTPAFDGLNYHAICGNKERVREEEEKPSKITFDEYTKYKRECLCSCL